MRVAQVWRGIGPVEHFKLEDFFGEVALVAEDDIELDCSDGDGCFAWNYAVDCDI
jgi:hypothetical protein